MDASKWRNDAADELDTRPINSGTKQPSATPRRSIVDTPTVLAAVNEENYTTNHPKRGFAVIINQVHFDNQSKREGSDKDRDSISAALRKLGFDVRIFNDLLKKDITHNLQLVADEDHTNCDCLVVVVMTHGEENYLYASDQTYKVDRLWEPFVGSACPTLVGKPKLFFIQACRGKQFDEGVTVSKIVTDSVDARSSSEPLHYVIPTMADLLVMYSTYDGHYSWRNPINGSWFIQSLSSELESNAHRKELLQMLTTVSRMVAFQYQSNVPEREEMDAKKQMPCIVSMLTRALYFPPK